MVKPISKKNILFLSLSVFALSYVLYRALFIGITYDEAWTIGGYVSLDYLEIINYTYPNANNHLLNTVLIKVIYSFGSENVFLARLPNVLAFVFYLYFAFRLSCTYFEKNQLLLFILLVFNPFLLDFFSLGRGYGLSLTFLLGSVWFLFKFIESQRRKFAFYALILAGLTVLSSFTTIYYFTALLFVLAWQSVFTKTDGKEKVKLFIGCILIIGALIGIIYEPFRKLMETDSLWYGGNNGFYSDTLFTLINASTGEVLDPRWIFWILDIVLILIIAILLARVLSHAYRNWKWSTFTMAGTLLLFLCIAQTLVNHWLFNTKFLVDRTALFLYPLFCIWLVSLSLQIKNKIALHVQKAVLVVLTVGVLINFALRFQLYATITWFQDTHTEEILSHLNNLGKKQKRIISFDASWPFRAPILYHEDPKRKTFPFTKFVESEPEYLDSSRAEYYIFLARSIPNVGYGIENEIVLNFKRDTLLFFEKEKVLVLKNKQPK